MSPRPVEVALALLGWISVVAWLVACWAGDVVAAIAFGIGVVLTLAGLVMLEREPLR